jgi:capsular exopolysaccharide synthesis family protein
MTGGGAARLIRVYAAWIVLVTAVVIAAAIGVSMTAPRVYRSEAIVVVEARVRANTTPVPPDMGTEKEIASSGLVVDPAARQLGVTPGALLEGLVISVAPDANVLTFRVTNANAATAQEHAEALAQAYVSYRNSGEAAGANAAAGTSTQHATVVTDAELPSAPVGRSIWINVAVGLAIGLLLGVGTALIRDRLSDRIRGRDDFERVSGATVLATVPRVRGRRGRRGADGGRPIILSAPQSPAAESFRYLRSRLQPLLRDGAIVLVTSAGEREGRTVTATNLAVAMAQAGLRVVLVDADLRNPQVHAAFGDDNTVGLTNMLAGEPTAAKAVRDTPVARLRLLAAGPPAQNAGDLLAGNRLRRILDSLRAECDLIVMDSGPVLSVSDTIALAAVSDHVLLVGDYRRTTRSYVARALDELGEVVEGNVSGVLLNAPRSAGGLTPDGRSQPAGAPPVPLGAGEPAPDRPTGGARPAAAGSAVAGSAVGSAAVGSAAVGSAAVPGGKPPAMPGEKPPAVAPAGHPAAAPAGHPAAAPAGHPAEAPAMPGEKPPAVAPAGHPAAAPGGNPAAAPAGHPAEAPGGKPLEVPGGHPAAAPSEKRPAAGPGGEPAAEPGAEPAPAGKAPVPTVYSSASAASAPAIPGYDRDDLKHPSGADLPVQRGDLRRRLTRRG